MAPAEYQSFMAQTLAGTIKPLRLNDALGTYESVPEHMIAVGGLYLSTTSTDPGLAQASGGLGYGAWQRYGQGRCVVGVDEGDPDWDVPSETRGAKTATPAGTNSAPTFTGTPSLATSSVSAGTPAGANSAPTFTGSPLAGHAHELPFQLVSGTSMRHLSAATFGTGTSRAASGTDTTTGNTTSAAVALSQSVSAGTPSGTVSAPTFTGTPLAGHAHTVTPSGTVSAPTFTGTPLSVVQPSIAVFIWRRVG